MDRSRAIRNVGVPILLTVFALIGHTAQCEVLVQRFFTPALGVEKHVLIYLPPSYSKQVQRRYPVAYYLHGATVDEAAWVSRVGIDIVMDSLIARGLPEMLLIMPDGDDGWYMNWAASPSYEDCFSAHDYTEDPSRHCVHQYHYDDYITTDLVGYVDRTFRTLPSAKHRGVAGLSMGGYGALTLALHHPDVFSAAVSHAGSVSVLYLGPHPYAAPGRYATSIDTLRSLSSEAEWEVARKNIGSGFDDWLAAEPITMIRRLLAKGVALPALYLDVGENDRMAGVDENRSFDAELSKLGVQHEFHVWPGGHDWRYWHSHVADGLTWLAVRLQP